MTLDLSALATEILAPPSAPSCWAWHLDHVATAPASEADRPWDPLRAQLFRHWYQIVTARLTGVAPAHDAAAARAEEIWIIAATQIGKDRSWLNAVLAYALDVWPRPIGYVMPRSRDLSKVLRGRIKPLILRTPRLARHLPASDSARADALSNSLLTLGSALVYPLAGGVANDLRSTPLRLALVNEFDVLPAIVQEEGDPIELLSDRLKSFPRDRLVCGATTPTFVASHGWRRLCLGTHERLLLRCRACDAHHWLAPSRLVAAGPDLDAGTILAQDAARWLCPTCDHPHTTDDLRRMIADACARDGWTRDGGWCPGIWQVSQDFPDGRWMPRADSDDLGHVLSLHPITSSKRSGWLNSLYAAQDITLGRFLAHRLDADAGDESMRLTHRNTWCAEPWLVRVEPAPSTADITKACAAGYPRYTAPPGTLRVLTSCDQQGSTIDTCWFPYVVRAFGGWGESWLVDAGEVHGWDELDRLQSRAWTVGAERRPCDAICLDGANGVLRTRIQTWAAADSRHRLVLRGVQVLNAPWIERRVTQTRERRNKRIIAGARVFSYDSTGWRNELDARMRMGAGGDFRATMRARASALAEGQPPGPAPTPPWRLPDDAPDFYLQSLTSEERVAKVVNLPGEGRRPLLVWQPRAVYDHRGQITTRTDNHWWDAEVMALVASDILAWPRLEPEPDADQVVDGAPAPPAAPTWIDTQGWQ